MMLDTEDTDRATILEWFRDFQHHDRDEELARFIVHCGIDIDAADDIEDAIAAHYRLPSRAFDIERAANDLATYPPVAGRIEQLRAERGGTDIDSIKWGGRDA